MARQFPRHSPPAQQRRHHRLKMALAVCVAILLVRVLLTILLEYRWYIPPNFDASAFLGGRRYTFFGLYRVAFYVHIASGPVAIILASFLLLSGGRSRFRPWHRWAGRVLALLVPLLLTPSGLVMARYAYAGPPAALGFAVLSLLTCAALLLSVHYARTRQMRLHRCWAQRCWLLLVSPLILRLMSGVTIVTGIEATWTYQLNAWASWLIPCIAYELWLRKRDQNHENR